ncbi:transient receptor potential cation channel subfamily M member-like 2 isoform X2 [Branchiostoma lanceolatum]|uniref:transient receptor potential cation channel subfamily M member-like 2 isoform X2 n=1 Tax=Branchiostoma lanceolatum TaxID=7740 RepID=UPI003455217D
MDHGDGQEPPLVGFGGTAGKWGITPIERQESGDRSRSRGERVGHARQPDVEMSVVGGDPIAPERRDRGHKSSKRRKKKKKQKENNGEVNPAYSHSENGENRNSDDVETLQNHNRTPQTLPPVTGAQPTHAGPPPRQPLPRKQDAHEDVIVPIDVEELQRCDVVDTGGGQNSRWNNMMGSLLGLGGGEERQSATHLDQNKLSRFVQANKHQGLHEGSFGEIEFLGLGGYTQRSPYIRVSLDVRPEALWELMTKHWELEPPNLLISVTGGAKKFLLKERLKNIFKIGLVKASQSTGAWIITGGMNEGVMKYVGEAIRDGVNSIAGGEQRKMYAIGIATWGTVDNRESLEGQAGSGSFPAMYHAEALKHGQNMAPLDLNHTHFILVDDKTTGKFSGADITVRTRLEEHIMEQMTGEGLKDLKIPVVLLVVEGGPGTLKNTKEAVEKKIPAVIIDGSGRAADMIAYGFKRTRKKDNKPLTMEEVGKKLMSTFELEYDSSGDPPRKAYALLDQLNYILHDPTLVTVFSLQEADTMDIDKALLHALLKAEKSHPESQLQLALAWNRSDIARQEIFTAENRKEWQQINMPSAMETALKLDKVEFVKLLLDHGVELCKFLTVRRLRDLYDDVMTGSTDVEASAELVRGLVEQEKLGVWNPCCSRDRLEEDRVDLLRLVGKVICTKLLVGQMSSLYSEEKYLVRGELGQVKTPRRTGDFENPMQHLLLWAVLMNRRELALLFWRMGRDHIASALTASKVLKSLAKVADSEEELDLSLDLSNHADEFEQLARGVINECYGLDKKKSHDLLIRRQENWGDTTCLAIASSSRHLDFMSQPACQSKLNLVWKGKMALYTSWWKLILSTFLPFMIFTIKFVDQEEDQLQEDSAPHSPSVSPRGKTPRFKPHKYVHRAKRLLSVSWQLGAKGIGPLQAIYNFHVAPVTKFMYTAVFYVAFLVIFSLFILTDLHPLEEEPIGILEWLTIAWLASLLVEELRQIFAEHPRSLWHKLQIWFSDFWNMMDCGLLLLFLLSLVLHVTVAAGPGFEVVRVMYCITLGFSFVRLPQLFMIHKDIGPKVIMIQKMLVDLVFFLVILLVFIFAYGVMRHTLIFPNSAMEWSLLTNVSLIPYWQVYGELFVDEQDGTTPHGSWLVYVLQGLYMLLTNVLLLNLLIAMFSFTFQKIQDNSEQVWRFHRYDLIYEFFDRPWGAPPVIILGHIWRFGGWAARRCGGKPLDTSDDFNRKFPGHEVSRQQALEKAGAENYLLRNLQLQNEHIDTKFATTSERIQQVLNTLEEMREVRSQGHDTTLDFLQLDSSLSTSGLEKVLDDLEDIKESVQAKEELEASFYVPPAADVTDSATLRTRPSSATASTSGVAVDLQHRMSNLEDHLGSIKDLLEHLQPTQAPGGAAGDSRGRAGATAEDRPTVARRPKSLVPQEYSDFPDPDDIM